MSNQNSKKKKNKGKKEDQKAHENSKFKPKKLDLVEDNSDDTATQDGYIGKSHPRKDSLDSSVVEDGDLDQSQLNEVKEGMISTFTKKMNHEKLQLQQNIDDAMHRMTMHAEKLLEHASLSGAQLLGITKKIKSRPIFSEKVFEQRDSLLTESSRKGKEAHTVFNIFVAILILIFMKMILHDVIKKGHDFIDLTLLYELYEDLHANWIYWALSFIFSFSIVFLTKLVISLKLAAAVHLPLYAMIQLITYVFPMYVSLALTNSTLIGLVLTCEMARFSMKIHAYYREKLLHNTTNPYKEFVPKFAKKRGVTYEDLNMPDINVESIFTELKRFNYFLWIPTLVYRDEYVMRPRISKSHLLTNFMTFNLCFYYTFAMIKGFLSPTFNNFFQKKADLEDVFTVSVVTGIMMMTMAFFGVLHSWMNMFAEITRFGDREFYTDWWNVSNYGAYYRKWNIIVHEWLYYYVYNDSVRFSLGNINSATSKALVFGLSAIIHEFIVCAALKFFFPILLLLFGGPGVIFTIITNSNHRALGIGMWFTLIIGNGILIGLYGLEFYARLQPEIQTKMETEGWMAYFIPQ